MIIDGDQLRLQGLNITKDISWERTTQDYLKEYYKNDKMKWLHGFKHVVVHFGVTGAIYTYQLSESQDDNNLGKVVHRLVFDPKAKKFGAYRDADEEGTVIGNESIFVGSILMEILELIQQSQNSSQLDYLRVVNKIIDGIKKGIRRCQYHFDEGYGNTIESVGSCNYLQKIIR